MPRMPLTEKNIFKVINSISGEGSVIYPIVLSIAIQGKPKEIRTIMERLTDNGILERYKSKIPFVYIIVGGGYQLK